MHMGHRASVIALFLSRRTNNNTLYQTELQVMLEVVIILVHKDTSSLPGPGPRLSSSLSCTMTYYVWNHWRHMKTLSHDIGKSCSRWSLKLSATYQRLTSLLCGLAGSINHHSFSIYRPGRKLNACSFNTITLPYYLCVFISLFHHMHVSWPIPCRIPLIQYKMQTLFEYSFFVPSDN
ncbi:hypothetical protein CPC08DRAFT_706319 [Agrocybe pediades]|nr:hypothetical protein CPC08DRAFT_706319 [Agrocybe pediades]